MSGKTHVLVLDYKVAYGPYTHAEAMEHSRNVSSLVNVRIVPLRSLSEEIESPGAHYSVYGTSDVPFPDYC